MHLDTNVLHEYRCSVRAMISHNVPILAISSCAMMQWVQRRRALKMLSASASLTTSLQVRVLFCEGVLHVCSCCM